MCTSCGEELCKNCHECHNEECERYVPPSNTCEITKDALWSGLTPVEGDKHSTKPIAQRPWAPGARQRDPVGNKRRPFSVIAL